MMPFRTTNEKEQIEPEDRKICAPTLIIMAAVERGWKKWRLEYFCTYFPPRYINIAMYNNDNISYDPPPCLSLTETAQHEINADGFGLLTLVLVEEERDS